MISTPAIMSGMNRSAVFEGTAYPTPTKKFWPTGFSTAVLMPITSPCALKSGPPELPGFTAASVCSTPRIERPFGRVWDSRSMPLMIPDVTVCS